MTNELAAYICLVFVYTLANLSRVRDVFGWVWVVLYFFVIMVFRFDGFDTDILQYERWMTQNDYSLYVYREIAYHLTTRFIYIVTNSQLATFLLLDFFSICLLYVCLRRYMLNLCKIRFSFGLYSCVVLSFPIIMGYQNFYRQHLGLVFAVCAFCSLRSGHKKTGFLLLVLSPLIHNSLAVFAPLIFMRSISASKATNYFLFFSYLFLCLAFLAIYSSGYASGYLKSNRDTGLDLSVLYLLSIWALILVYYFFSKRSIRYLVENFSITIGVAVFATLLSFVSTSTPVERISGMVIVFALIEGIDVWSKLRIRQYQVVMAAGCIVLSFPMIAFDSTRTYLTTSLY